MLTLQLKVGKPRFAPASTPHAPSGLPSITNTHSVDFDGTDDTITIPQGTFDLGSGNWTLSMWVRPTNISATSQTLLLIEGNSGVTERLGFFLRSGSFLVSDWFNTNITYSTTINNSTWYHLLVVKNGNGTTDIHIYFNGTKVVEGSHPFSNSYGTDSRDATLGDTGVSGSSFPFEGQIDEFGFWKSALSASDISLIYNSGIPNDISSLNPVGWWRMGDNDGGTGTTITDQGSGGNDGTLTNGPTFSTNAPRAPIVLPSITNTHSVEFDGNDDFMACGTVSALNNATNFTVSMWVNFQTFVSNGSGYNILLGAGTGGANRFLLNAVRSTSNTLVSRFEVYFCDPGAASIINQQVALNLNRWYHMAVYKSGDDMSFYIDNTLMGSRSDAPSTGSGANFAIARGLYNGLYSSNILVDEVAVWDSDQSSNKESIYNSGVPADISSLNPTHWWRMGDNDGGTGTTITDQGSGGNDGTLTNGPTFSTNAPRAPIVLPSITNTHSVEFDGNDDFMACGTVSALNNATNFTVSMWVNFQTFVSNGSGYNILLGAGTGGANRFLLNAVRSTSNTLVSRFEVYFCDPGAASIINQQVALNLNRWYHMAVYKSGDDMSFYIDNTLMGSRSDAPSTGSGANFAIARGLYNGLYSSNILVDEVAVWDSDQSSNKESIYNSGVPADISSLNPTHWWRMGDNDGGTGTTITDQGSGGNDGTLTNGPTFSTNAPQAPLVLPSITNTHSVEFDGTNDYMDFGTNTTINSTSAFSVSAWFDVDNISTTFPTICNLKTNLTKGFVISLSNTTGTNSIYNGVWFGSAFNEFRGFATNNSTLSASLVSGFHHVILTYDGVDPLSSSSFTIYVDGVNYSIRTTSVGLGSYANANYIAKGAYQFDGLIDEFAIFNTELTQREVTGIYNSGIPNDISSLNPVGWWRMGDNDGGTGTTITDQGSGGNDGTLTNGPTFSTNVPQAPLVLPSITNTHSVEFDGTNDYMDFGTNTTINSTSAFSVSAWFDVDNISTTFPTICNLKTNLTKGFVISLSNTTGTNSIYNGVWFGSAFNEFRGFATNNSTLSASLVSGFHHVILTYDGVDPLSSSSFTIYVDGVNYSIRTTSVGLGSYANANYIAKGAYQFDGLIDEFAIFNTELTQREVTGIYNSGIPNDISSLNPVGWWRMGDNDGGTGTTITDQGSGGNDGTLTNGPTFSTTVPS